MGMKRLSIKVATNQSNEWMNDNFYFSMKGHENFLSWLQDMYNVMLRRYKSCDMLPRNCPSLKEWRKDRWRCYMASPRRATSPGDFMESQSEWEKPGFEFWVGMIHGPTAPPVGKKLLVIPSGNSGIILS
jgi:hypothetical protein